MSLLLILGAAQAHSAEARQWQDGAVYNPATKTFTVTEPPYERWAAPAAPMPLVEALRHWDGTGELLLAPDQGKRPGSTFGIGATFDNSDATDEDRDAGGVDLRCPALDAAYRLREGTLTVSRGIWPRGGRRVHIDFRPDQPGLVVSTDHCRYHLVVRTRVRFDGEWIDAPEAPPPPPPALPARATDHTIKLEAGQTFVMRVAPLPQELSPNSEITTIGARLKEGVADGCPEPSGTILFEPRGVFFDQAWPPQSAYTPGLRRDPEAPATTLIFQNAACREEIRVTREVQVDGAWRASPLSHAPRSGEPAAAK